MIAHVLHMPGIKGSDPLGSLRSGNTSALLQKLLANFAVHDVLVLSVVHQSIVKVIASSDYFNLVHEVRVNGGQADTTVVHLTSKDFVSEEVVTENGRVTVCKVVALG